jgi:hypothetical protein
MANTQLTPTEASALLDKPTQELSTLDTSGLTDFIKSVVDRHQAKKDVQAEQDSLKEQQAKDQERVLTIGKEDFQPEPVKTKDIDVVADLPVVARAFLDTISVGEGTNIDKTYNAIVGLGHGKGVENAPAYFEDYSMHPNVIGYIGPEGPSTAAGRYQITYETWKEYSKRYNLTDFNPENQDKAAWYLAKNRYYARTGRDLEQDLSQGDTSQIKKGLGKTWTSLQTSFNFGKFYTRSMSKYSPEPVLDQVETKTDTTRWSY